MTSGLATLAQRYSLETVIGTGGMATVWRARDNVLARTVAVKVLRDDLAHDQSFVERFHREAFAAARLSHPNIVAIYDTGSETTPSGESRNYIVTEHCGGGSLDDLVDGAGALAPQRVADLGSTICDALAYAHASGIIHRDIKPANILLTDDGAVKVADFGIAKAAYEDRDITASGVILGTVTYIAPEQARGEEPTQESDLYSLGATLYHLLVGRPPFTGDTPLATALKHVEDEPPRPRSIKPAIPKALEAVVLKSLAKDPGERYPTAAAFRQALQSATSSGARPARVGTRQRHPAGGHDDAPAHARSEYRWVLPVAVLLLLAAGVAFVAGGAERAARDRERQGRPGEGAQLVKVQGVADFDPHGGEEHSEETQFAIDGNESTTWQTETYDSALTDTKPGVGLLFDLGDQIPIERIEVVSPSGGYSFEVRAANEEPTSEVEMTRLDGMTNAPEGATIQLNGDSFRYWLIWITSLPGGGGGNAEIAEARFFGS